MTGRPCKRGCTIRGTHFAACPDFGRAGGACRGCAPVESRAGSFICERCYDSLSRTIDAAPDVLALIRSKADPLKAAVYDRVLVSGSRSDMTPAPVQADFIDAADDIIRTLREWAYYAEHGAARSGAPRGLQPGSASDVAYDDALECTAVILAKLDRLTNDAEQVAALCDGVLGGVGMPDTAFWTVARALRRWPLEERAWWAAQPCPECDLRAIKVNPARFPGGPTLYSCRSCRWQRRDNDAAGYWALFFSPASGRAA
ncbi:MULTISPECIES: hypothetical protein [unclassified Cryobacterium]|uniref:hypothetical protein n=1 Tax=unclassified Cryobacterium TaxID=2649013 RepID=UPI002AB4F6FA|nr:MULTISPECIES: hypothetical protein [unclassified Cryobacterium]MDY7528467.1 hypothetical protein [Cryobacterium sp. 10C2]MDY7555788.1 hypothetical protein [Cryobacterium sp. 10C3]MEB0289187.1 hypothetical protein [Cryobacterium sp. 10C2]